MVKHKRVPGHPAPREEREGLNTYSPNAEVKSGSGCKKCIAAIVIAVLVVVVLVIALAVLNWPQDNTSDVCVSLACVNMSAGMLSKMGLNVDPCKDFHEYACQTYNSGRARPGDKADWNVMVETGQRTSSLIRELLENNGAGSDGQQSTATRKAKQFYAACMNVTNRDSQGTRSLLELIKSLGSWPVTSEAVSGHWSPTNWSFENALSAAQAIGVTPFYIAEVITDYFNTSRNIIQVDQQGLLFPSSTVYSDQSEETFHRAYITLFTKVVVLLGADAATGERYAEDVWQLEKALAGAFVSADEHSNIRSTYNLMTLQEFQALIDQGTPGQLINMPRLLAKHFHTDIQMTETIIVSAPAYFRKLSGIVANANSETLASYIVWSAVRGMAEVAGSEFERTNADLKSSMSGVSARPPLWEQCIEQTNAMLGYAIGALYVNKYFSPTDRRSIEEMVVIFKEEFSIQLSQMDWMDEGTRKRASEKAQTIAFKVGYPDFIINPRLLDQYYRNFTVTDSLFANIMSYKKFAIGLNTNKFQKAPDKDEWYKMPTAINAYYLPNNNQMVLPAGILQPPFYHHSLPMSVVFGAIGSVLGHELIHGFDTAGRQFDKHGNLVDLWGNASVTEFIKRSQCFIDQYSGYQVNGHRLNGVLTLGENIADNGGVKLSYAAYNRWVKKFGIDSTSDQLLPGLNMTQSQQFFLGMAQLWCGSSTDEIVLQSILTNEHSHIRYRVNGAVRNMPDFAQSFTCSKTAELNPQVKCTVW